MMLLAPLHPLPQLLGGLPLVHPEFGEQYHQARIHAVGFLLAVFALELPTQEFAPATWHVGHVLPSLGKEALQGLKRIRTDRQSCTSWTCSTTYLNERLPATRPTTDYTARVVPQHSGVAVPLEATQILWQR
jgi:hypothetical protein